MDSSKSVEDVCQILSQHGFSGDVVQGFRDEEMDGAAVCIALSCSTGPDCLKDIVKKAGPRLKVYDALKQLQSCCRIPNEGSEACHLNISLMGCSGVGKSTLASQYCNKEINNDLFTKQLMVQGTVVNINVWENQSNPDIADVSHEEFDCCVIVFDVTSSDTFTDLDTYRDEFLKQRKPQNPYNFPFILIGNKIDLLDEQAEKETLQSKVQTWCENNNSFYYETNANDEAIVGKVFDKIVQELLNNKDDTDDGDQPCYTNPADHIVEITCWVCSSYDLSDQKFSDADLKALSKAIASSDSNTCCDITVQLEKCYRRCYNTQRSTKNKPDSSEYDEDKAIITVKTKQYGDRVCNAIAAHYKDKSNYIRVILEEN